MKKRVLFLTSFRYIYGSKNFFKATGEDMYLDTDNPEELKELKYLLSPFGEYSQWVHIDEDPLVSQLRNEINQEYKGQGVSSITTPPSPVFIVRDELPEQIDITQHKEENFLSVGVLDNKEEVEEVLLPVETLPQEDNQEPLELLTNSNKASRLQELNNMHWKKLEKLAETLGLDYTSKDETIEKIINQEFNI